MTTHAVSLRVATAALVCMLLSPIASRASDEPSDPPAAEPSLEDIVRAQQLVLERLTDELKDQRSELASMRTELAEARHEIATLRAEESVPLEPPPPSAPTEATADKPDPADKLGELAERWGRLRLSGDIRMRYEGFFNQGYDAPQIVDARNRIRLRARALLQGTINEHFDWGLGLATGSYNSPNSSNQTIGDFYDRKPFGLDLAFLHFDSKTQPIGLEVHAGKIPITWKHTSLSFDENLHPEGATESIRFEPKETALTRLTLSAWQLPFKEEVVGPDGILYGGQVLTEWSLTPTISMDLAATYHDFEHVDLIAPAIGVSPTLVNAGIEYGTTNALQADPVSGDLRYKSDYRIFGGIAEVRYTGIHERWPLFITVDWLHNTSAYNNERDAGTLTARFGRTEEQGDIYGEYTLWKAEREAFPSVFMESNVSLQTNSFAHIVEGGYMFNSRVLLKSRLSLTRRLETLSPLNRWQNRLQVDLTYKF